jgi:hypothetical protein
MADQGDLYPQPVIGFLELLWGRGWLSPGGPDELARLLQDEDLEGRHVLDIGCGAGGIDCLSGQRIRRSERHRHRRRSPGAADGA